MLLQAEVSGGDAVITLWGLGAAHARWCARGAEVWRFLRDADVHVERILRDADVERFLRGVDVSFARGAEAWRFLRGADVERFSCAALRGGMGGLFAAHVKTPVFHIAPHSFITLFINQIGCQIDLYT